MPRYLVLALSSLLALAACGGSGGGYGGSGGGGGTGGGGGNTGANVTTLTVENFQPGFINMPYVSVTVCQPNTSNCMTIDHVEVDTGSWGLRIMSTTSNATFLQSLPQQLVSGTTNPVVECAQFADGFTWGPVVSADVTISGEKASGIAIHVMGAPAPFNTDVPSSCSSIGMEEDTVGTFGANGIIGVGVFAQDCGSGCASAAVAGTYYSCPPNGAGCNPITESLALQVSNPVASFAPTSAGAMPDNNGVIVEMPSVAAAGATSATGTLIFGIGTQSNNARGNAQVFTADQNSGLITVTFQGTAYDGLMDTGSNAYFFPDSALTVCSSTSDAPGFFCTAANISTTLTGTNGTQAMYNFATGDASAMIQANPTAAALPQIGGPSVTVPNQPTIFSLGMPFFYGRNVFVALEGAPAGGTTGPYFAY